MRIAAVSIVRVVLFAAACGGGSRPAPAAPAPTEEPAAAPAVDRVLLAEIADGLVEMLATMAVITEGAADCPTMATQLGGLFDKSAPLFDLARGQDANPEAKPILTAEMDGRATQVQPLVDRISAGLARCQLDAEVAKAIERMPHVLAPESPHDHSSGCSPLSGSGSRRSRWIVRTHEFQRSSASTLRGRAQRLGALVPLHGLAEALVRRRADDAGAPRKARASRSNTMPVKYARSYSSVELVDEAGGRRARRRGHGRCRTDR